MIVKAIGKYGRFAPYGEGTNAYLFITRNNKKFMIDFGAGALARIQEYIKVEELDAVILTHLHYDHISDMGTLAYCINHIGANQLKVYAPTTPPSARHMLQSPSFDVEVLDANASFKLDNVEFSFLLSTHPVETYAVKMEFSGHTLVYTSDISSESVLKANLKNADYVIGDACILEKDYKENSPHVSVSTLAKATEPNAKLFLAHLDKDTEEQALEEALKVHKNTQLIKDFEIIE